jgi:hypothetical protein
MEFSETRGNVDDKQLQRTIQSIGKGCFVKYYEAFRDPTQSNENLIELLMTEEGYTETACRTRVSHSRRIIDSGHAPEILAEISNSAKLDYKTIVKAKELLRKYPT